MSKPLQNDPDLLEEYDFEDAEMGKYAARNAQGTNVVVLDDDAAAGFRTAESVDRVLREPLDEETLVTHR